MHGRLCAFVNLGEVREAVAPSMTEQLGSWQPEPIGQGAPCLLILNWLGFPASAADTHSRLVLSENKSGPQWEGERDRGERQRYRDKIQYMCVCV